MIEIVLTDGAAGGNNPEAYYTEKHRKQRIIETQRGGSWLGVGTIKFWGYADAKLALDFRPATQRLLELLRSLSPMIIVFPSSSDTHADHASTHGIALSALAKYRKKITPLQYCFWGKDDTQNIVLTHPPGILAKEKAIKEHKSQPTDKYLHRLYESDRVTNGYERYHNPNPDKTISILSSWGFNVQCK